MEHGVVKNPSGEGWMISGTRATRERNHETEKRTLGGPSDSAVEGLLRERTGRYRVAAQASSRGFTRGLEKKWKEKKQTE